MSTTTPPRQRVLTPLDKAKTERVCNIRTRRFETWEATSEDGRWCYVRDEISGTPWSVYDLVHGGRVLATSDLFPTLTTAREWTAEQAHQLPAELAGAGPISAAEQIHMAAVDCPSYAWDESDQAARIELGAEFYGRYAHLLDTAAHELIRVHLRDQWHQLGHRVHLLDYQTYVTTRPTPDLIEVPDEQRWKEWQTAADQITAAELIHEARLTDEWAAYRRAHQEAS